MVSLVRFGAKGKSILYGEFLDTSKDDVRLARAVDVIHVLECLKRANMFAVLDELQIAGDGRCLSDETKKALGADFLGVFCSGVGARGSSSFVLSGVQGVISEVLKFDESEEVYSIHAQRFLGACADRMKSKLIPEVLLHIKEALNAVKVAYPDEKGFAGMCSSLSINLQDDFPAPYSLLSHFRGVVNDGQITPNALGVLRVGFDPETYEQRLEF